MSERVQTRRATPPRPSMLVGDLQGCHDALEALQAEVVRLQMQEGCRALSSSSSTAATDTKSWERLVPRCRAIRETLTSLHELSDFSRQVYELSVDVCLRSADFGEALKCLQHLVTQIYVKIKSSSADLDWHHQHDSRSQHKLARSFHSPLLIRWPEMAAVLLLLYKVCASSASLDISITLRRIPVGLLVCKEVQLALKLINAFDAGNHHFIFTHVDQAPNAVQLVLLAGMMKIRHHVLVAVAAAYRCIDVASFASMLGLQEGKETRQIVIGILQEAVERGHHAAKVALNAAQSSGGCFDNLYFR